MKAIKKLNLGIITLGTVLLFNCTNETREKQISADKEKDRKELAELTKREAQARSTRDSVENSMRITLDEIENNLHLISQREGKMAVNVLKREKEVSRKDEILNSISAINSLLEENRAKMKKLNRQLASVRSENKHWKAESEKLQNYMTEKEGEINSLKDQLAKQSFTIEELNTKVADLTSSRDLVTARSEMQDKELHKAYYTTGTYSQLKKNHIIRKEGGVLGLGRTQTLEPTAAKTAFTEIDTRNATGITISGKKAKLITHHPVNSYELKKEGEDVEYLTIKDPDKFWSTSKYLVVEVK